jgi:hypothetical protein
MSVVFVNSSRVASQSRDMPLESPGYGLESVLSSMLILISIAFITENSSLGPFVEGLCARIHVKIEEILSF